ncbi:MULTISPECIES: adenylate/guanylate cyclase domain-containing protein [Kocuria]|uniref:adenylate/guanylate cyclase domain-containing protein n=1 Tax=Kocuria TaxID=57493 RepID=UPI0008A48DA1|nr:MULTISPECIES: adenylate/guanylate cyclase domain-containing protein [Kocuria]MBO4145811.1 adenylate/guanylate cyclase domain-containing protein [Kocuria rhizophila]MCG7425488.1 adenylate/guanylate cyclase domain-containing protein [Kocuria rhizophila]MCT1544718.1 adenylate/guanylate cyclase domain-containing protein [Kocuria rhizophila]MCT1957991.1 adenylate/guanylate cyclase domain-containing protein [Kocuria rhizophila]MCT2073194.1 adenylate/guanylate cyclase domain-containing protein [Ko
MAEDPSESPQPVVTGPQTEQLNLNLHNPVQSNLYGSEESQAAVRHLDSLLLGSQRNLRRREAAHEADLSSASARKIWRALGFPNLSDDDVYFTNEDVRALKLVSSLVQDDKLSEEAALSLARSVAQLTDRMVVWQVEALVEDMVAHRDMTDARARRELLTLLPDLLQPLEQLLDYAWRRQLSAAVQRLAMRGERPDGSTVILHDAAPDVGASALPLARGVGFADLVSYTSLSRQMNERTLANLVQRFEKRCAEVISIGGGRVIKTIGDEVMFLSETPEGGAQISLALARIIKEDPLLPQARVAFVWGRVLPRLGDLYGPTVNLASRLVALTEPGGVVVDESTARVLRGDERFVLEPQPTRNVRGFGDVRPVALAQGCGPLLEDEVE